jgi:hypothetical protein
MVKKIIKAFEKIPIIGGLINCSYEDFSSAAKEITSTLIIATSPIWLGAFFILCRNEETRGYFTILIDSLSHGELMIYCMALLAPVFYITSNDKYLRGVFPNKLSSIISAVVILLISSAVYALQRTGYMYNQRRIFTFSVSLFLISLLILFVNKVYNNSKITTYIDLYQREEKDFSLEFNKHRKEK